jgi:hypothetical protein
LPDFSTIEYYPLNIQVFNAKYFITAVDKKYESILGKEIQSINGVSIDTVINNFSQYISSDNANESVERAKEQLIFPYMWKNFDYSRNDDIIEIRCSDGTTADMQAMSRKDFNLVTIPRKTYNPRTALKNELFSYSITDDNKICYLQFNSCFDYNSALYQIDMTVKDSVQKIELMEKIAVYPKFDDFLEQMFDEILSKNVTSLVVDVRHNSGGNSMLCDQLLSYLFPIDSLKTESGYMRISNLFIQQYSELFETYKKNKKFIIGNLYNLDDFSEDKRILSQYFKLNDDAKKIYSGKIYFLQGKTTYSSAGDLIVWARDNKIGSLVGEKSIYRPCNYGDILTWKLPNTELTGGVSFKYFTRPDISKCNEEYIIPDIFIPSSFEDVTNGEDVQWNWVDENVKL